MCLEHSVITYVHVIHFNRIKAISATKYITVERLQPKQHLLTSSEAKQSEATYAEFNVGTA